jgi:hypothetical protein
MEQTARDLDGGVLTEKLDVAVAVDVAGGKGTHGDEGGTVCTLRYDGRARCYRRRRMYLRHLKVNNCKLMRELEASFVNDDGTPRMWTVFVGENGTCKTTLLRTIALSSAGAVFANKLVNDPAAYLDRRRGVHAVAEARFGFSDTPHPRSYPMRDSASALAPELESRTAVTRTGVGYRVHYDPAAQPTPTFDVDAAIEKLVVAGGQNRSTEFRASMRENITRLATQLMEHVDKVSPSNPVDEARGQGLPHWFVAAYGTGRVLTAPLQRTDGSTFQLDRLQSLFDLRYLPMGTGFSDELLRRFGEEKAKAFSAVLREALVERLRVPNMKGVDLQRRGTAAKEIALIDAHSFEMRAGTGTVQLPAVWLSQGYQAVVSLVADIIGHVWLDAGTEVALDDMEGLVLVDELDLHLHPKWQTEIVQGLKRTFPKMQFIVTTHSPLVLAGCEKGEVIMLVQDPETGDVTAQPRNDVVPMLLTGSELNREFFGVQAAPLSEDMRRYYELAYKSRRTDEEDALAQRLLTKLRGHGVEIDVEPVERTAAQ